MHSSTHIPSLDGWRAVAILIVLTSHLGLGHIVPGGLGVTIFFFLSGYLITTLLIQEHGRNGSISISNFYIRRALRLMPPLVITLALVHSLTAAGITQGNVSLAGFTSQLLYFANYYYLFFDAGNTTPAGTGIFWSLAVEEHFYLAFPFLFGMLYKRSKGRTLMLTLMAVCVITLAWRYALVGIWNSPASRTYYATDTRIDSIVFGCLLALCKNPMLEPGNSTSLRMRDYLLVAAASILLAATLLIRDPAFRETLRYTMQGIALAPLFFYSIRFGNHWMFKALNSKPLQKIGMYSYSIYLIHYIVIENMHALKLPAIVNLLMIGVITGSYAFLIDRYIDTPCLYLRRKFR